MNRTVLRWLLPTVTLSTALVAAAQTSTQTAARTPSDPLDAQAAVPAATYQSSLSGYRMLGDEKPVPWRDANATVGRIGGWRSYAREANEPDPAPASANPAAATPPAPSGAANAPATAATGPTEGWE